MADIRWLTVRDVANALHVHEETVRRWIRRGDLVAIDLGGPRAGYRIRPSDLDTFIENSNDGFRQRPMKDRPTPDPD